jgi:hypothetical protein
MLPHLENLPVALGNAKDISFLIQHLDIIVQSLGCVDEIAPFQPVPADQLFKKSKSAAKPEPE